VTANLALGSVVIALTVLFYTLGLTIMSRAMASLGLGTDGVGNRAANQVTKS
jgi:hypothetical protein